MSPKSILFAPKGVHTLCAAWVLLSCITGAVATEFGAQEVLQHQDVSQAALPPIPVEGGDGKESGNVPTRDVEFELKHVFHHGTYQHPGLHRRLDVDSAELRTRMLDSEVDPGRPLRAQSISTNIQRLVDRNRSTVSTLLDIGRMTGQPVELDPSEWTVDEVPGPNVTDKESVLTFARISADAYVTDPEEAKWIDVEGGFNYTEDFGWEADGLRGHIFADTENRTVVIGMKGTSAAVFDGSETTTNDKENDNLFFSCCCGQGGNYLWRQVCDCKTETNTCNSTCLVTAIRQKNRYYYAAQDLYHNVTALYPDADIWLTGHSLGGAVSSLLGMTYGLPVVTYEGVPEALPASRLGLPTPPGYRVGAHNGRDLTGIHHFGHTADPVYMGKCNGASSFCTIGGYALQSQCHAGKRCVYDTVGDLGWRVGLGTHSIVSVIRDVIEKYDDVPVCVTDADCTDCFNWSYFESNGTDTTTSSSMSSTTSTRTRTETCKTPGWWGCLDETTTTTSSSTTTTTSSSTSTCKTPGWFGCKDPTTTSSTKTPASTSVTTTPTSPPSSTASTTPTTSTTCHSPGWFGGCNDPTSTSSLASSTTPASSAKPSSTTTSTLSRRKCRKQSWFGGCKEWDLEL